MTTKKKKATKLPEKKKAAKPKETAKKAVKSKKVAPKAVKTKSAPSKDKKRPWLRKVVTQLSPQAQKLIKKADDLEVSILDSKDQLEETLGEITKAIDGVTFMHPDRGPMTVMVRNGRRFWRPKPQGV